MTPNHCFHCGLKNPNQPLQLDVSGETKYFCCAGCHAAAQTILQSGLGEYYRFHQPDQQPADTDLTPKQQQALLIYDRHDVQSEFVSSESNGTLTAVLLIDGISCSACTWLIEKRLLQLEGVISAHVNSGTHRLTVQWNSEHIKLSEVFKSLFLIGYRATPYVADEEEKLRLKTERQFILRLGVAGIGMMQAMMNAVALYSGDITSTHELWLWWTSLFLTLPVIFISAWPFFVAAWRTIKTKNLSMDVSVSLAILSAFFASLFATLTGHGEVYYESVNMFTFFLVLSRFLEFRARTHSISQGNSLAGRLPDTCTVIQDNTSSQVSVRELKNGHIIELLPGEVCPIDGIVEHGETAFDESTLTGEFKGIQKRAGDTVLAGTTNQLQAVKIRVSNQGTNNSFNFLQQMVERASREKSKIALLADMGSRQFIWTTLVISLLIGLVWLWIDASKAFWIVISVLVVTCPCALSLATPTALAQATSKLKKEGFVITRGYVLERLQALEEIAFDKTGTLTEGRFVLTDLARSQYANSLHLTDEKIMSICAILEHKSEHAISVAFEPFFNPQLVNTFPISSITNNAGQGISGSCSMGLLKLGSNRFTNMTPTLNDDQGTRVFLTLNDQLIAEMNLSDRIRSTVGPLFSSLSTLNIKTNVLTGDSNVLAEQSLRQEGLSGDYKAGCSPDEKLTWVKNHEADTIAVVGDGINDAPLLAGASVSIAMLDATDLTKTQADVLLLTNNLTVIASAIRTAKRTHMIIRQNLLWALIYNAVALPIAAMGWVSPWQAAIGMSVSSLLVVGNALRLRN